MVQLHDVVQTNFVVSRLMGADGKVTIPKSSTRYIPATYPPHRMLSAGCRPLQSRHRSGSGNGLGIGPHTCLRDAYSSQRASITAPPSVRCACTTDISSTALRVNRAGVDLLASPNLRLQMGDRITVVGNPRRHRPSRLASRQLDEAPQPA